MMNIRFLRKESTHLNINWVAINGTLIAGISTGIGAIPIYFKRDFQKKQLDMGLGFSAGIMLIASFLSLIIPAMDFAKITYSSTIAIAPVILGLSFGYLFITFIHQYIPHEHIFKSISNIDTQKINRTLLIILAISLHNIPEGLSVGVGFGTGDNASGLALAIAISIQNMPEGLVVALSLLSIGQTKHRAFFIAMLTGLIEPVFALFGFVSTVITSYALPIGLAFAGGAMLFVVCQELLPDLFREQHQKHAMFGVLLGLITMLMIDFWLS